MADARSRLVVIILARNEASNIRKAIASVEGLAPVIVVDSGSRDQTPALAAAAGAHVVFNDFVDYATQRNFALAYARDRYEWVFFLDADEELTPALWRDIEATIGSNDWDGAYVGYTYQVLGHVLKFGGFRTASVLRLMRASKARFTRGTNERVDDRELRVTVLPSKFVHADTKPLAAWFRKHIEYAEREASHFAAGDDRRSGLSGAGLSTKGGRTIAKRWAYNHMPLFVRPWLQFGRTLVIDSAWRDGVPGLMFALMQSLWYPLLIDLLIYERTYKPGESDP